VQLGAIVSNGCINDLRRLPMFTSYVLWHPDVVPIINSIQESHYDLNHEHVLSAAEHVVSDMCAAIFKELNIYFIASSSSLLLDDEREAATSNGDSSNASISQKSQHNDVAIDIEPYRSDIEAVLRRVCSGAARLMMMQGNYNETFVCDTVVSLAI
jgi:hypothetical protein